MTCQQPTQKSSSFKKITLSALSISALLALSACSGGDNTATEEAAPVDETAVVVEEETAVVEEPAAVEEPAVVEEAPVEAETPDVPADDAAVEADTDSAAEPEVLAANAGEELYNKQCMACHQNGLLNAPKFGDKEAWAPRIAKGVDTLHMHSAKGFNQMPAQATNGVTDAQVYAAVDYMIAAAS